MQFPRRFRWRLSAAQIVYAGAAVFLVLQLIIALRTQVIYWDEAVFLTMGKFLASGGASGFWEHIRPPGLPLLVAAVFHSGAAVLLTKLMLVLLATLSGVLLYYLLAARVRPIIAALAAMLLLYSQVWFSYANLVLTDVAAASLCVVAVWLYNRDRTLLAGLVAATAFLVRFPAGLLLLSFAITELVRLVRGERRHSAGALLALGFAAPVAMWLFINLIAWHDQVPLLRAAIRPLIDGFSTAAVENSGLYVAQSGYYSLYFLQKIPAVLVLAVLGLSVLWRSPRAAPLAITAVLGLLFFEWLPNDQLRFAALFMPGMVLLAAWGAQLLIERWRRVQAAVVFLLLLTLSTMLINDIGLVVQERTELPARAVYYEYLADNPVDGLLLVTDPLVAWHAPNYAVPVYFGLFSYADAYMPSAAAVAWRENQVVCYAERCASAVAQNRLLLEQHYTPVFTEVIDGEMHIIYVRSDLQRADSVR